MADLTTQDINVLEQARNAIRRNYDHKYKNHTVGSAVLCKSGRIYTGVNVYSLHGACAEQVAIGSAITQDEREFLTIVAVRGEHGDEIIPPCGNCRQILADYAPDCNVILKTDKAVKKIPAKDLLPYSYSVE